MRIFTKPRIGLTAVTFGIFSSSLALADEPSPLSIGVADHAFDHLGDIGDQAPAAAASGATIIYTTGFGPMGYLGLPEPEKLARARDSVSAYIGDARGRGVRLSIGYVCATSIVKVGTFDRNWTPEFRGKFKTPPGDWLQQDHDGKSLPSWYGGDYRPACMNNPDWRTYEKELVRLQLQAGNDGIFFDNPTVHPQGCYCEYCMRKFEAFLHADDPKLEPSRNLDQTELRKLAVSRPKEFRRFRTTIAADFLREMGSFARTINSHALITCNNSLNSPEAFFSQCRTCAYDIDQMSRAEDFVVVEDMGSQPRVLADGRTVEYGPVYQLLRAISHGKPVVAVTLADGDYHTPANLMRLAMAEAAAHGAAYLAWPTWPENVRQRMIASVRPEADLLRQNASLLNNCQQRADVLLFLPFRRWEETSDCAALNIARALEAANVQFEVVSEEDLAAKLGTGGRPLMLIESESVLHPSETQLLKKFKASGGHVIVAEGKWLQRLQGAGRSLEILTPHSTLRSIVWDQHNRTIVHLLNLNVQRLSSFQDNVTPLTDVQICVRVPAHAVHSVMALSADPQASRGPMEFDVKSQIKESIVSITIPRLVVSTILSID
jgi:hypothetical protein